MEHMPYIRIKTAVVGLAGSGSSWVAYLLSEECDRLLSVVIKALSIIPIVLSIYYIRKINKHRLSIKAIEDARAEIKICTECRAGKVPYPCPIDPQPQDCPHRRMTKREKLTQWLKDHGLYFKSETTKD
jgi:hypothetical protein